MRGEVRVLLFWIGRDAVGGGHIRVARSPGQQTIEVLFGSDPQRTPGRVNRWGFGRETATVPPSPPSSVFEGVMLYSPEQTLSKARQSADAGRPYQAIVSRVTTTAASSEVRLVDVENSLDFRSAPAGLPELLRSVGGRPPDDTHSLSRASPQPWGFLTTVYALTRDLAKAPPSSTYVYNARLYRIDIRRRRITSATAAADFEITNLEKGTSTVFSLETPREGVWAGIPTRITFQPRWWLRLRLDRTAGGP
jgi:hypothetical protein